MYAKIQTILFITMHKLTLIRSGGGMNWDELNEKYEN